MTRTLFAEIQPRTTYELTELGSALTFSLGALRDWAEDNIESILAARASHHAAKA